MRRSLLALGAAVLASTDCRAPTQITVTVTTDIDCAHVDATSVAAGSVAGLDTRPSSSETTACSGGRVGALVVVPSGSSDAEVGLRVVMGLDGKSPDDCVRDGYVGGCVVARRALRFLPYEPLSVPVEMRSSCRDVGCASTGDLQTCVEGQCVAATIPDPHACQGSGCNLDPGDGGVPAEGAAPDGGASPACDTTGAEPNAPWPMYQYCAAHRARSPFVGPQTTPRIVWSDYQKADWNRGVLLDEGGNVYVTTADGKVVVVDSNDQFNWMYTSTVTTTPAIAGMGALGADGTLYVPQGTSIAAVMPGGAPKWSQPYAVPNGIAGPITLAPSGDVVFHDTVSGVYTLPPDGKTVARTYDAKGGLSSTSVAIALDGSSYFSADTSYVFGVDVGGHELFKQSYPGVLADTMALDASGNLRLVTDGNGGTLFAFATSGAKLWQTALNATEPFDFAVADDGTVYVGLSDNLLHAYDASGAAGKTFAGGPFGSPTIGADGTIYVCGGSVMYAFRPDGSTLWSFDTMFPAPVPVIQSAPAIGADGALYVSTTSGDLVRLGP
jgi:hypothetical protein